MITLQETINHLNLEKELTLEEILKSTHFQTSDDDTPYHGGHFFSGYGYREKSYIKINTATGNAALTAYELLHYPELMRALRKLKHYPTYTVKICESELEGLRQPGIKRTIHALEQLDKHLDPYRQEKARLDATVNNLVLLHSQERKMPIFQGSKPYYKFYHRSHRRMACRLIDISGLRYFSPCIPAGVYRKKYYQQAALYQIEPQSFLQAHLTRNKIAGQEYKDKNVGYVKNIVGGIRNTPFLIFRCAKTMDHRGKHYYLDLHTGTLYGRLSEAREIAKQYAGKDYHVEVWE